MHRAISWLRDARWLDQDRATAYARVIAAAMALALSYGWVSDYLGHHPWAPPPPGAPAGKPQPGDFVAFWSAGRLAVQGHAASAYEFGALSAVEHAVTALAPGAVLPFFYPPPFLLLCLPFALLPYFAALLGFVGVEAAALAVMLRRILPRHWGMLPVLAFPGFIMNAATGQNGCITAALFAAPVLLLETRPFLAGACLGALVYKPQLALCVPVALFAARRGRAIAGAAASSMAIVLLAWAAFGTAPWLAFGRQAALARTGLETNQLGWQNLQSLFAALRIIGAPAWAAYGGQLIVGVSAAAVLARVAWRRPGGAAEASALAAAAVLSTPYVLDYDLAVIGAPLAWLAARAQDDGWRPWEKIIGAAAFLWPLLARDAVMFAGLPLGPFILLAIFAVIARRAGNFRSGPAAPARLPA